MRLITSTFATFALRGADDRDRREPVFADAASRAAALERDGHWLKSTLRPGMALLRTLPSKNLTSGSRKISCDL
jgi:hypothetical protein